MRMPTKAAIFTAALCLSGVIASPANAAAAASPESICGAGYGRITGGTQPVKTSSGRRYGTVYLLYNRGNGYNCVVTIKSSFVGTRTPVSAELTIMAKPVKDTKQDPIVRSNRGNFKSYAGPVRYWAQGRCVKFWGTIKPLGHDPAVASGGRAKWGNCG
ncbi:hypothetical protein AB0L53_50400 [Nonomuraea sp. NPDC052129]|uniref:hypothetical protein n=1 Tax=Nonomuraea sp. NPDC052129 TaxID=3154651 RepID=UPI00342612C2